MLNRRIVYFVAKLIHQVLFNFDEMLGGISFCSYVEKIDLARGKCSFSYCLKVPAPAPDTISRLYHTRG